MHFDRLGVRGVRVNKSPKIQVGKKRTPKASAPKGDNRATSPLGTNTLPAFELRTYALIHVPIGQTQSAVATQNRCMAWSMQSPMAGMGRAYICERKSTPRMSADLIHYNSSGHRELANSFLVDFGRLAP